MSAGNVWERIGYEHKMGGKEEGMGREYSKFTLKVKGGKEAGDKAMYFYRLLSPLQMHNVKCSVWTDPL